jgi:hypothetical protein
MSQQRLLMLQWGRRHATRHRLFSLRIHDDAADDAAAIFLSDPERQAVASTEHLRVLYKLSPTEARVATQETVRADLKHIYVHTSVNRQSAPAHLPATAEELSVCAIGHLLETGSLRR